MASVHLSPIASAFQCLETADGDHHPHTPFCSAGAPTLATLLRKPLQENCNTQAPTPESTPSPPKSSDERKRLAKLEARKTTRSAAVIWAPKKKQSSLQQDLMPYLQYRARQRRDAGPNRDSVWDDEVEKAFMEAIRVIPPMGKEKLALDGKLFGRNQLISEYIFKKTGKRRAKKQVSSHIQVLKNLLPPDSELIKFLSLDIPTKGSKSKQISPTSISEKRASHLVDLSVGGEYSLLELPPILLSQDFQHRPSDLKPVRFAMWIGQSSCAGPDDERLHTYTNLLEEGPFAKSITLWSIPGWKTKFPHLEEVLLSQEPLPTIIHMECTLAMMATLPIESSILGTLLEVKYLNTLPGAHWECTTRIYVPRKEVWSITQDITNVVIEALDGSTKLRLPYASEFFAAFFTGLSQTQYSTERQAHPNSFHICRKQEKEAMAAVGGITVIQELFASTSNFGTKERIAIILSEFTKVEAYQPGIAQWREVIPPLTSATAPPAPVSPLISPAAILNYAEEWPLYTPTYDCFSMHYNNSPYFSPMDDSSNYSTSCGTSFDEGSASQGSPVAPPSSARDSFSFQNYMSEASYSVQDIPQNQQHQQRQQHPHGDVSCSMTVSGASTTSSHMPPMCPPTTTDFFATTLAATGSMQDWVNNTRNI